MKILSWNCRGLGSPRAIRSLKDVITSSSPSIVGLKETKLTAKRFEALRCHLGFYGYFPVNCRGKSGGFAILWKEEVSVHINSFSQFHIDMTVNDSSVFRFTLFYGQPEYSKRYLGWNLIRTLSTLSSLPWLISGDFNEILNLHEISSRKRSSSLMSNFREVLNDCNLSDLDFCGYRFTYTNKRKGNAKIKARLDRSVVTPEWRVAFLMQKFFI